MDIGEKRSTSESSDMDGRYIALRNARGHRSPLFQLSRTISGLTLETVNRDLN